jgi:hypothetical protein
MQHGISRRTWVRMMAGVALTATRVGAFQGARRDRVVIAGGGIIGQHRPPAGPPRPGDAARALRAGTGTTANSFAWINAAAARRIPRSASSASKHGAC